MEELSNADVSPDSKYQVRADIENRLVNGLTIINGGACVALLAFVQAIYGKSIILVKAGLVGILIFGLGVFFAALVNLFRYQVARASKHGNIRDHRIYIALSYGARFLSLAAFLLGLLSVCIFGLVNV